MKTKIILPVMLGLVLQLPFTGQAQYAWTKRANFPPAARSGTITFDVNSRGYVFGGLDEQLVPYNDLWRFNDANNAWTQMASKPGSTCYSGSGFSLGNRGYICMGWASTAGPQLKELWQYNPGNNTWAQKTSFPGAARYNTVSFIAGGKAYVGLGYSPMHNDFYEYNPGTDTWTILANTFPGAARQTAVAFSCTYQSNGAIHECGFVGTGSLNQNATSLAKDFWRFEPGLTPGSGTWTQIADLPGPKRYGAFEFAFNGKGYVGGGRKLNSGLSDFYEYDPVADHWKQLANFPGKNKVHSETFTIHDAGFVTTGENVTDFFRETWKYGPDKTEAEETALKAGNDGQTVKAVLAGNVLELTGQEGMEHVSCRLVLCDLKGSIILDKNLSNCNEHVEMPVDILKGIYVYRIFPTAGQPSSGKIYFH